MKSLEAARAKTPDAAAEIRAIYTRRMEEQRAILAAGRPVGARLVQAKAAAERARVRRNLFLRENSVTSQFTSSSST